MSDARQRAFEAAQRRQEAERRIKHEDDPEEGRKALMQLGAETPRYESFVKRPDGSMLRVWELLDPDEEEDYWKFKKEGGSEKSKKVQQQRRAGKDSSKHGRKQDQSDDSSSDGPSKSRSTPSPRKKGVHRVTESEFFNDNNKNRKVKERVRQASESPSKKRARSTGDSNSEVDQLASDDDGSKSKKKRKGRRPKTEAEEEKFDAKKEKRLEDLLEVEPVKPADWKTYSPKKPADWKTYSPKRKEKWRKERGLIRERNEIVQKKFDALKKERQLARATRKKARQYDQDHSSNKKASSSRASYSSDSDGSDIEILKDIKPPMIKKKPQVIEISDSEDDEEDEIAPESDDGAFPATYWCCNKCQALTHKDSSSCLTCLVGHRAMSNMWTDEKR